MRRPNACLAYTVCVVLPFKSRHSLTDSLTRPSEGGIIHTHTHIILMTHATAVLHTDRRRIHRMSSKRTCESVSHTVCAHPDRFTGSLFSGPCAGFKWVGPTACVAGGASHLPAA